MTPRTGRPKSENPKTVEVKARIDVETNEALIEYCKKYNVTRTDVVRQGIRCVLDNEKK
ncbi:MAG: CopG family transcriptional regulator [Firmicutes bacterium HGW-Firmicutes-4]|jgi:antitoxin component of RelBE/YafQ-DinJ toxin-antitoxin module|nr:MAG: CopG family transcriptional regulator [Firmicutes bacterium HGW-Firmicutes-4]